MAHHPNRVVGGLSRSDVIVKEREIEGLRGQVSDLVRQLQAARSLHGAASSQNAQLREEMGEVASH